MGGSFPGLECCGERGRRPLLANLPCARLCAGGCTDVCSFILLSAPPGRWHPSYATDEVKRLKGRDLSCHTAGVEQSWNANLAVSNSKHLLCFLKRNEDCLDSLSPDAIVWPETPGRPILGPPSSVSGEGQGCFPKCCGGGGSLGEGAPPHTSFRFSGAGVTGEFAFLLRSQGMCCCCGSGKHT